MVIGVIRNLALLGRNGGERRYLLGHTLAAAVRADYAALFEISDVKNLGELFVAILTEKNVLRHGRFLLNVSSHMVARLVAAGNGNLQLTKRAGQLGESERLAVAGRQGAHSALSAARAVLFERAKFPQYWPFPQRCGNGPSTASAEELVVEGYGSSGRTRTYNPSVNRRTPGRAPHGARGLKHV